MTPDLNQIYTGNCLEVMQGWPENFVDSIITDPPYGLEFMGKEWDHGVPGAHFWVEALRVAKPGAMLLAFGGTRTYHRLAVAIEDAGWQIRDCLMWLYGSGFPKSLDISKALDKSAGHWRGKAGQPFDDDEKRSFGQHYERTPKGDPITATAWDGYGTALKPAWEPILMAMKPLDGTYAENAEKWGVAGLNVDGGRIGTELLPEHPRGNAVNTSFGSGGITPERIGRWPANLILDEESAALLDGVSGVSVSKQTVVNNLGSIWGQDNQQDRLAGHSDSGGASRFFYVAKAASRERNEGMEGMPLVAAGAMEGHRDGSLTGGKIIMAQNHHPTVKPLDLMKYLVNLTRTPSGGIVLDPFSGSGTTLWAAESHNRPWLGIELNPEYVAIANARLAMERAQLKMPFEAVPA